MQIKQDHDTVVPLNEAKANALWYMGQWAMVYDALQQRTGQTLWPHQYGHATNVLLTLRRMDWLGRQLQHTHCSYGHVYCDDRESLWPPRGPAMFRQKGMQKVYQK